MQFKLNAFGRAKAQRFRARFNLCNIANGAAKDYVDFHDYLHTHVGALPI